MQMSALSHLFAGAQSSVLHPLFTSALPHRCCFLFSKTILSCFHSTSFSFPLFYLNLSFYLFPSTPSFSLALFHFLSFIYPSFCNLLPFFTPFLLHPSSHAIPPPSPRSWIMALYWSNIMTFPVLSSPSASSFGLNPLHHHHHQYPLVLCFASILRHECVRSRLATSDHKTPSSSLPSSSSVSFCLFLLYFIPFSPSYVFIFLLVSLYPSLYPSAITAMTHVASTCSAVKMPPWFCRERLEMTKVWLHIGSVI